MIEWRMHCDLNLLTSVHLPTWLCEDLTDIIRSLEANVIFSKQAKQCTYNVTLRRVRAGIVAVEKQWEICNLFVCL